MIGLVISNKNLLCGSWKVSDSKTILSSVINIKLDQFLSPILHDEKELNRVLSTHLNSINESIPLAGEDIIVSIDDDLLSHGVISNERDMGRDDHLDFIDWKINSAKQSGKNATYSQTYLPDEPNIHYVSIPTHLGINLKMSLSGIGCVPIWLGPVSSTIIDWGEYSDSTWVHRSEKGLKFYSLFQQQFHFGNLTFSKGNIQIKNSTADDDFSVRLLGLQESDHAKQTIISTGSLTPKMKDTWSSSTFIEIKPFEDIECENLPDRLPSFESIILTIMAKSKSYIHSINFFNEPGLTDCPLIDTYYDVKTETAEEPTRKKKPKISKIKKPIKKESGNVLYYLLVISILFLGMNYLKYRSDINDPIWPFNIINKDVIFKVDRTKPNALTQITKVENNASQELINKSHLLSATLNTILENADLNKFSTLTLTKNFISLEYTSIVDPEFSKIIDGNLVSYSEEKETGSENVIRYYSYDLPRGTVIAKTSIGLTPEDVVHQLDSSLSGYSLKYFDHIYKDNHIYEPLLVWVKTISEINTVSRILNNAGDRVLFRKFVLFNNPEHPQPKAGFYISFLKPNENQ